MVRRALSVLDHRDSFVDISVARYTFAKNNDVVIIDEYDQLINDLRPYWLLTGKEIRRRSVQVGLLPSVDLVRIEGGKTRTIDVNTGFDDAEVGARAKGFRVMLEKFQGRLSSDFWISSRDLS